MSSLIRHFFHQFIWIGLLLVVAIPGWGAYRIPESSLAFGRFRTVTLYSPLPSPIRSCCSSPEMVAGTGVWWTWHGSWPGSMPWL